jgi:hypothetical protein
MCKDAGKFSFLIALPNTYFNNDPIMLLLGKYPENQQI